MKISEILKNKSTISFEVFLQRIKKEIFLPFIVRLRISKIIPGFY